MFSKKIGIDLGTANIVIVDNKGTTLLNQSSVIAYHLKSGGAKTVLACGDDAKLMQGKSPISIQTVRPLADGVISSFEDAEKLIREFLKMVSPRVTFRKPHIIVCVPYEATPVEKRAIQESVKSAGAGKVGLISEPMAAAIGVGLPVTSPRGNMIVDIGGGTTEIAIISLGGIVTAKSLKVAGNAFDHAIIDMVKKNYDLDIGWETAERIKKDLGQDPKSLRVTGLDRIKRLPKEITIPKNEIHDFLAPLIQEIANAIHSTIENAPPDLAADIVEYGISLTGGGALLAGIDRALTEQLDIGVWVPDAPLLSVAKGTGLALNFGRQYAHMIDYDL